MGIEELPQALVGTSGEYFVAAELSRRGLISTLTLKNTKGIDILATNHDASKSVGIQVKTNRGSKKDWLLSGKADNYHSETLFYVFVNLNLNQSHPSFHIVPSKTVADFVRTNHKEWLETPNRKGEKHNDTSMRHFYDENSTYLNKWDLLGL